MFKLFCSELQYILIRTLSLKFLFVSTHVLCYRYDDIHYDNFFILAVTLVLVISAETVGTCHNICYQ